VSERVFPDALVVGALKQQLRAALAMLRAAVAACPDDLWLARDHPNAFWQVAYHALYFTDLYLRPNPAAFVAFPGHQTDVQNEDGMGAGDPGDARPPLPEPYARSHVLAYADHLAATLDQAVDALDLTAPTSGFPWYPGMGKLEHLLVNLRHLQHHAAQLADRLRTASGTGVGWVAAGYRPPRAS